MELSTAYLIGVNSTINRFVTDGWTIKFFEIGGDLIRTPLFACKHFNGKVPGVSIHPVGSAGSLSGSARSQVGGRSKTVVTSRICIASNLPVDCGLDRASWAAMKLVEWPLILRQDMVKRSSRVRCLYFMWCWFDFDRWNQC